MVTKAQDYDRKSRILIMENMGVCMRMFARTKDQKWLNKAKEMGETAKLLSERIKNQDYTQEDAEWRRAADLDKAARDLWAKLIS